MRHVVARNIFNALPIRGTNKFRGRWAFLRKNEKKCRLPLSTLAGAQDGDSSHWLGLRRGIVVILGAPP